MVTEHIGRYNTTNKNNVVSLLLNLVDSRPQLFPSPFCLASIVNETSDV